MMYEFYVYARRFCYVLLYDCRIIVSAPNGTADSSSAEPNTGVMYTCTVTPSTNGECQPLIGDGTGADRRLYDREGEWKFKTVEA